MGLDFVAIDFETANRHRHSMCQVGMTRVLDGRVDATLASLVRPPDDEHGFEDTCVAVHGITAAAVVGSPDVAEALDLVAGFSAGLPLVAHNAPFDAGVLTRSAERAGVALAPVRFACTLALSRRLVPGLGTYRLRALAETIGFDLIAHDAGSDSAAAAALVLWLARLCPDVSRLDDLMAAARITWREIGVAQ